MVMSITEDFDSLAGIWREMEALPTVSVHQTLAWTRAWNRSADKTFVLDYSNGGNRILLPLEIKSAGFARIARPVGTNFSNLNGVIAALDDGFDPEHFVGSLSHALEGEADMLLVDRTVLTWRGQDNPLAGLPKMKRINPSFQLELEPEMSATLAKLDCPKRMKMFRSNWRKLEAAGGWFYEEIADPVEASRMLSEFFAQKDMRFRAAGLPNVFRPPEVKAAFQKLVGSTADSTGHILRLHVLRLGDRKGRPIAIAGISTKGDYAISQFGSVDETAVQGASPGEFLYHLLIERCCKTGFKVFDFGIGDQPYKRRWCNVETPQFDLVLVVHAAGSVFAHFNKAASETKRLIKERPQIYRAIQALRSRLPGGRG